MPPEFKTIGVVGLGTMGAGIAEVIARHGFEVVGLEQTEEQLELGRGHVQHSTDRARTRAKLTEAEQAAILDRMRLTTNVDDLRDCDLVIEAVVERLEVKRAIFLALDEVVRPDAVLATNTSSLSVTELSAATAHPRRVIGIHFFNPAPVQRLVEVVSTVVTEPRVISDVEELTRRLGKRPVTVGDQAGFIANALLFGYLNHAVAMYESRHATREDIDTAIRLGCGYPMGPLALLDLIGLDTACQILDTMHRQGRNRLHAPSPILRQFVAAGLLGRKSGRGFYTYAAANSSVVVDDAGTASAHGTPRRRRPLERVGVVGSGALASRIGEVVVKAGIELTQTADATPDLRTLATADLVIEAVAHDLDAKTSVLAELDRICRDGAILATTTSSSVIEIAAATSRQRDVVGLHFLDLARPTQLVEVVSTVATDPEVAETMRAMCAQGGAQPVSCGDRAGFIVNALLFPYLNDAVRMLDAHYADADDIDLAMRAGCALPLGPFEVLDSVGTDVALDIQRAVFRESREPGFAPAPLLEQLVTAGHLGRKSGRGFREHPDA